MGADLLGEVAAARPKDSGYLIPPGHDRMSADNEVEGPAPNGSVARSS